MAQHALTGFDELTATVVDPVAVVVSAANADPRGAPFPIPGTDHGPDGLNQPSAARAGGLLSTRSEMVHIGAVGQDQVRVSLHARSIGEPAARPVAATAAILSRRWTGGRTSATFEVQSMTASTSTRHSAAREPTSVAQSKRPRAQRPLQASARPLDRVWRSQRLPDPPDCCRNPDQAKVTQEAATAKRRLNQH